LRKIPNSSIYTLFTQTYAPSQSLFNNATEQKTPRRIFGKAKNAFSEGGARKMKKCDFEETCANANTYECQHCTRSYFWEENQDNFMEKDEEEMEGGSDKSKD
jgi:hypothetical protein